MTECLLSSTFTVMMCILSTSFGYVYMLALPFPRWDLWHHGLVPSPHARKYHKVKHLSFLTHEVLRLSAIFLMLQ